jgi:gliding motility-associated-like protein
MKKIASLLFLLVFATSLKAQTTNCPAVFAGPDVSFCGSTGCDTLNATVQGTVSTSSYGVGAIPYNPYPFNGSNQILINIDDIWSAVIPMPFCFEYFGQTYNSIVIGSNAIVTFDLAQANQYCQWPISAGIPSNSNPVNSIMAPFHDIDPSVGGFASINWEVYGTAPCREFVISWDTVPMFSCNNMIASSQLVLHESTNVIDVFLKTKPLCAGWNAGAAILGIQDQTGTNAYVVPGYNYPAQWTAQNEGWRFSPTGTPNYTFGWYDLAGNLLSNSQSYYVCPTSTTSYVAVVNNSSCAGPIVVSDTVTIGISPSSLVLASTSTPAICNGSNGTATTNPTGTGPFTYSWQPGGQTTQSISGIPPGAYYVYVTDGGGCTEIDTVYVTNTNPPINPAITSNAINGIINQPIPGGTVQVCFNNPTPGSVSTWSWVYQGTQTSSVQAPCFNETDSGLVCVILAVTDTNGCVDTSNLCIRIQSEAIFSFPNVFTPNADGSNDLFLATTIGVKDLNCVLYDRWGMEIYSWNGVTSGWNGKGSNGKDATDGVYYWVATVTDFQGKEQRVTGFVHLLRG